MLKSLGILTCVISDFSSAYDADGNLHADEHCHVSASCPARVAHGVWQGFAVFALMEHAGDVASSDPGDRLSKLYSEQHACKRPGKKNMQQ